MTAVFSRLHSPIAESLDIRKTPLPSFARSPLIFAAAPHDTLTIHLNAVRKTDRSWQSSSTTVGVQSWKEDNHLKESVLSEPSKSIHWCLCYKIRAALPNRPWNQLSLLNGQHLPFHCFVSKEEKEERSERRIGMKAGSTRNSSGEWASDCEARNHKQEDVKKLHLDGSMKSEVFGNASKELIGFTSFLRWWVMVPLSASLY